jgi:hypothetical protein
VMAMVISCIQGGRTSSDMRNFWREIVGSIRTHKIRGLRRDTFSG